MAVSHNVYSRTQGAIPLIDYNPKNEHRTAAALRERGYDHNGWPYAPCGILCRPNGFDFASGRASFSCRRLCVESSDPELVAFSRDCPHSINDHGFTKHMSVKAHPRLITEVLRGTERHQKLKGLRSASERTNASAKEDFSILNKPKVRGLSRAAVLAQMAVIVVLLKKLASFIVKVTLNLRRLQAKDRSPPRKPSIPGPKVPRFLQNLIQRE